MVQNKCWEPYNHIWQEGLRKVSRSQKVLVRLPLRNVKKGTSDTCRLKHATKLNYLYEWAGLLNVLSPRQSLIVLMGPEQCRGNS